MTFPTAHAVIDYNEAGEPTGWDYPTDDAQSFYCDFCGFNHEGACPDDREDEDEDSLTPTDSWCESCESMNCECENDICHCGHPECGSC